MDEGHPPPCGRCPRHRPRLPPGHGTGGPRALTAAVVRLYLERIDPYITVAADRALSDAKVLEDLAGAGAPPPCGVPLGLKDVVDTVGRRTTFGTELSTIHV